VVFEKCSGYVQDKENARTEEPVIYYSFKDATCFGELSSALQVDYRYLLSIVLFSFLFVSTWSDVLAHF
jgi:hypothetical protein